MTTMNKRYLAEECVFWPCLVALTILDIAALTITASTTDAAADYPLKGITIDISTVSNVGYNDLQLRRIQ
jgi:hypothetical protein